MMRISTQQIFNSGIEQIQEINAELQETQLQISTGKRINRPSDDPAAASRIVQINQELETLEQYQANAQFVQSRLELEDTTLESVGTLTERLREITIRAGNGTLTQNDRRSLAVEVRQLQDQLAGIMNSKDPTGEYLFAGFQGTEQPFQKSPSGAYQYVGDEGRRFIQIDDSVTVAAGDNGKDIFVDIESAENTFFTQASANNQSDAYITTGQVVDQEAYDEFYPEDLVIEFGDPDTAPVGPKYTITQASDGKVLVADEPFSSGEKFELNGIEFRIVGTPQEGDSFQVQSSEKQGLLTTVDRLASALETFGTVEENNGALDGVLQTTLANLDNIDTSVLETRASVGARLNTVESTQVLHEDVELLTRETLSEIQDLDYAEAISRLNLQSFILQAAQQTYTKVTSLNLFDLIR